jgi:hypothetical protein
MRYKQVHEGGRVVPKMSGYKMACCDCGLVHRMKFEVFKHARGHKVAFRAWRDERATAGVRRGKISRAEIILHKT